MLMVVSFFCAVFLFFYGVCLVFLKGKRQDHRRVEAYLDRGVAATVEGRPPQKKLSLNALFKSGWTEVSQIIRKRMPVVKAERIELKLAQAGYFELAPADFRLIQVVSLLGTPVILGLAAFGLGLPGSQSLLLVLAGLIFGALMPNVSINSRIKKRAKQALRELPDFVDLMTVSLEAGLGFDAALNKVIEKQKGVLADEFHHCLDEVRLGKTRREGLAGIKNRLNVEEISTLINSVIRAEKLGVGMVQVLRVQSVEVRDKRRQRAEEQAMKAPIKILFPLVLFIFPSLFIIILGPAAIQIIETFKGISF
ncbi:MAG TPA: type II secretion system F family protein [Bacillales bacterium]|nr:type II secretion system F family protein [Bacillales bacterium]